MSKEYFPNNWEMIANAPDEVFKTCTAEEFFDWKVGGWELPSSIDCIIRCENQKTGKIKEFTYTRPKAATKKVLSLMEDKDNIVVMATDDEILLLYAEDMD